jgi:septum formation protein
MVNKPHYLKHHVLLASGSPRRAQLISELGLKYTQAPKPVDEIFPDDLAPWQVAEYLAELKSKEYSNSEIGNSILITADTLVATQANILNKPDSPEEAFKMLKTLSGNTHKVITGVCLRNLKKQLVFHATTEVSFYEFSDSEINYYLHQYQPFDKAGSYGIQEWIGSIGVESINGSYNNVVGLPTSKLVQNLKQF